TKEGNVMRGPTGTDTVRELASKCILVRAGIQHDGGVYGLDLRSQERILNAFPGAQPLRSIKLGHYRESDFERLGRPRWKQTVLMLTGLTREQIAQLGGVTIYDTDNKRILFQWPPETFNR